MIRLIFKNELKPRDEDCAEFLSALWKKFEFQYPVNTTLFKQAAELYENATNDLPDARGDFAYCAGHAFLAIERFGRAKDYAHKSKKIREDVLDMWDIELAKSFTDVGIILKYFAKAYARHLDDFKRAYIFSRSANKHFVSAYAIFLKSAPDNPHFGEVYLQLANSSDDDKAIELVNSAIDLFKKQSPKLNFKLAAAYSKLGHILKSTGKNSEALEQMKLAAETYKNIAPPESNQDLALSYVDISDIYKDIGDHKSAIEYLERAITIQEKVLVDGHPDTFQSYKRAVDLYQFVEGYSDNSSLYSKKINNSYGARRKYYGQKMLESNLLILNGNIPLDDELLAHRYRSTAESYRDIGDYENAEKYILMAEEKISDDSAPIEVWLIYFTASQIYGDMKRYETAVNYVHKAIEVTKPDDSSNLYTCYTQLHLLQNNMKNTDR